jgi:hypothetical protein
MDFVKALLDSNDSIYVSGIAKYENDKFTVTIKNIKYNVVYNIAKFIVLYSLPTNTIHPHWTKRIVKSIPRPDIAAKAWSPIKHNQRIKGTISGTNFILKPVVKSNKLKK